MASACKQELCPYWTGDGRVCVCALFDIDEDERAYVSKLWAADWDSVEDSVYDG